MFCQTARQVEGWFRTHQLSFPTWEGGQFHFADATGEAVVLSIGATGDYVFTWKENDPFLVSTNFNLANSHNRYDPFPCPRFEKATEMLWELDEEAKLTIEACADILDTVHIVYKDGNGTVYSNVFGLVNKRAYIYHLHDFDKVKEFDLAEELSKMESNDAAKQYHMKG